MAIVLILSDINLYVPYVMCVILHTQMPIGDSGRIVLEIEPLLKRRLYSALALEQMTLKDWFIEQAEQYVHAQQQPRLFGTATKNTLDTKS